MLKSFYFWAWIIVLVAFGAIISNTAKCEDSYQVYRLPKGKRVSVAGEVLQGYNLAEMKLLLSMDADLKSAEAQLPIKLQEITQLRASIDDLRQASALDNKEIDLLKVDLTRKDKLITTLTGESLKLQEQLTRKKRALRITVAVVSSIAAGCFISALVR